MVKNTKTVYEIIQNIPVESMITLSFTQLREFEAQLKEEVITHTFKHRKKTKEYHRAVLVLRWIRSVIRIKSWMKQKKSDMDKKTTILLDTAGFLTVVHNCKKSEIADLIVALCEFNLYGCTSVKLADMKNSL